MAKLPRAVQTRIAATVTARYYPSSGAADGFYLDGRLSGRREHRAADITLDREGRGFFYSVFAHLGGSSPDDAAQNKIRKAFGKIHADIHQATRNIDSEINELAECAVSVAGRISLQHDGVRQPYFAGIVVKDSELAAVTMGNGCAYLYRGDVLYPLTADDYPIDAIDGNGKPVQGIDVYCAGVAGTVRYSNIAQLQLDDCIIVCNKEIMDSLGQRDVLRLLFEAEDQADAAGLIITAAAAKLPGVPMQFMIGFVESITAADRTNRLGLGRLQSDNGSTAVLPPIVSGRGAERASFQSAPAESRRNTPAAFDDEDEDDAVAQVSGFAAAQSAARLDRNRLDEVDELADDYDDDDFDNSGRGRRIAFYLVIAVICVACIFAIYSMLWGGNKQPPVSTTTIPGGQTTIESTTSLSETTEPGGETTGPSDTTTAATAPTTTSPGGEQLYTVQSGDTLWGISMRFYDAANEDLYQLIRDANDMTGDSVFVGQVLKIPPKP